MERVTFVVTSYSNALLRSTATTPRICHRPAPRLWLGAQTANTDRDWRKQLKRFAAGAFCFETEKNSFKTVLFQFHFNCANRFSFYLPLHRRPAQRPKLSVFWERPHLPTVSDYPADVTPPPRQTTAVTNALKFTVAG